MRRGRAEVWDVLPAALSRATGRALHLLSGDVRSGQVALTVVDEAEAAAAAGAADPVGPRLPALRPGRADGRGVGVNHMVDKNGGPPLVGPTNCPDKTWSTTTVGHHSLDRRVGTRWTKKLPDNLPSLVGPRSCLDNLPSTRTAGHHRSLQADSVGRDFVEHGRSPNRHSLPPVLLAATCSAMVGPHQRRFLSGQHIGLRSRAASCTLSEACRARVESPPQYHAGRQ